MTVLAKKTRGRTSRALSTFIYTMTLITHMTEKPIIMTKEMQERQDHSLVMAEEFRDGMRQVLNGRTVTLSFNDTCKVLNEIFTPYVLGTQTEAETRTRLAILHNMILP